MGFATVWTRGGSTGMIPPIFINTVMRRFKEAALKRLRQIEWFKRHK